LVSLGNAGKNLTVIIGEGSADRTNITLEPFVASHLVAEGAAERKVWTEQL